MSVQVLDWPTTEAVLLGSRLTLLYGPPGTGKTTAAYNAARKRGQSVYAVTLTDETPAAALMGHFIPCGGGAWTFMEGPATRAFRTGGMLVVNELNHASGDALDFLHALLDDPDVAQLTIPDASGEGEGETVFPGAGFAVVATMNGDLAELESDRPAIADRFAVAVYCGTPHPDAIAALPEDLQAAARNSSGRDEGDRPATLRRWKAYAQLRDVIDPDAAARAVFAHRAGEVADALKLQASR